MPLKTDRIIFIVSGPSGAGKTYVLEKALENSRVAEKVITTTSREPRKGEADKVDYYFISKEKFEEKIKNNEFLEWAKVHGNYYGTSIRAFQDVTQKGKSPVLIIDPQGAAQIRTIFGKNKTLSFFIKPESLEELRRRMAKRDGNVDELRYQESLEQIKREGEYNAILINFRGEADFCAKILSTTINFFS